MQGEILDQQTSDALRVYVVWLPMLWTDARFQWDGTIMPDSRVLHYWDGDRAIGQWFALHVDGDEGVSWDAYYLYGSDAAWEAIPSPRVASGGSVYSERSSLQSQVRMLLAESQFP